MAARETAGWDSLRSRIVVLMRHVERMVLVLVASAGGAAIAMAAGAEVVTGVPPRIGAVARVVAHRRAPWDQEQRTALGRIVTTPGARAAFKDHAGRVYAAEALLLAEGTGFAVAGSGSTESRHESQSAQQSEGNSQAEEPETGGIFKVINFVILAAGLVFLLRKPLHSFLADRTESIRQALEEGRRALEASQSKLQHIEDKLGRLEEEIAGFKAAAAAEMEAERERFERSTAEEADKIVQSARTQIEISARAAKLELKAYTAEQAVRLAEELVRRRLDDTGRHRLVSQFVEGLKNGRSPGT